MKAMETCILGELTSVNPFQAVESISSFNTSHRTLFQLAGKLIRGNANAEVQIDSSDSGGLADWRLGDVADFQGSPLERHG
jgi:hypothetical protein